MEKVSLKVAKRLDASHFHVLRHLTNSSTNKAPATASPYRMCTVFNAEDSIVSTLLVPVVQGETAASETVVVAPYWMSLLLPGTEDSHAEKCSLKVAFEPLSKAEQLPHCTAVTLKVLVASTSRQPDQLKDHIRRVLSKGRPLRIGSILPLVTQGDRYLLKIESCLDEGGKILLDVCVLGPKAEIELIPDCDGALNAHTEAVIPHFLTDSLNFRLLRADLHDIVQEGTSKNLLIVSGVPNLMQPRLLRRLPFDTRPVEWSRFVDDEHMHAEGTPPLNQSRLMHTFDVERVPDTLFNRVLTFVHGNWIVFSAAESIEASESLLYLEKAAKRHHWQVRSHSMPKAQEATSKLSPMDELRITELTKAFTANGLASKEAAAQAASEVKNAHAHDQSQIGRIWNRPVRTAVDVPFFGNRDLYEELKFLLLGPFTMAKRYEALGLPLSSGFLLHGPSGCGKTSLLRKILLTELSAVEDLTILHVPSGSTLLSKYFGETEGNIRRLFAQARARAPSVLFIDQIESIGRRRQQDMNAQNRDGSEEASTARYLSTLLNEMDGISGKTAQVTVVACANNVNELDEALLRPGRLDRHLELALPDTETRLAIIQGYSLRLHLHLDKDEEGKLVASTDGLGGGQITAMLNNFARARR
jgi:hypothetical protein